MTEEDSYKRNKKENARIAKKPDDLGTTRDFGSLEETKEENARIEAKKNKDGKK